MSQDTRKDKRAKVVSLNVRYKSATVDEFIENHSHDVSKGGLFVKTPTPFPPGTLLKFEIRLAGDKSVISGVGRVVWKREPTQAGADKPAGMGVKFIKIDDSSRTIIDRLITQKADAGSAYTSESPMEEGGHPSTLRGLVAAAPAESAAPPAPSPVNAPAPVAGAGGTLPVPAGGGPVAAGPPAPAAKNAAIAGTLAGPRPTGIPNVAPAPPSSKPALPASGGAKSPPPRPGAPPAPVGKGSEPKLPTSEPRLAGEGPPRPPPQQRKATMMGMGSSSSPPPAVAGAGAKAAPAAEPMFPRLEPDSAAGPAREQTVMKQAAELLEEALKEAGGSLDDIGHNPLFTKTGEPTEDAPPGKRPQSGNTVIMPSPSASAPSPSAPLTPSPASVTGETPSRAGSSPSQPPAVAASAVAPRKLSDDLEAPSPKKKGGIGGYLALLVVLLAAGGGVYAWQTGLLAGVMGPGPTPPSATTAPPPPPSAPPSAASSEPAAAMIEAGVATTDAAADAATEAGAAAASGADAGKAGADAGKAGTAVTQPPPAPKPQWRPPPPKPQSTPATTGETPPGSTSDTPKEPAPAPTATPANEP